MWEFKLLGLELHLRIQIARLETQSEKSNRHSHTRIIDLIFFIFLCTWVTTPCQRDKYILPTPGDWHNHVNIHICHLEHTHPHLDTHHYPDDIPLYNHIYMIQECWHTCGHIPCYHPRTHPRPHMSSSQIRAGNHLDTCRTLGCNCRYIRENSLRCLSNIHLQPIRDVIITNWTQIKYVTDLTRMVILTQWCSR